MAYEYYNTSVFEGGTTSYLDLMTGLNLAIGQWFSLTMLAMVFFVIFLVVFKKEGNAHAGLLGGAWVCSIMGLLMFPVGLISGHIFVAILVLTALLSAGLFFRS